MENSMEVDECSFEAWLLCNICESRAYKNPKHLFKHKILFHSPQNGNTDRNKENEKSRTKRIGGVSENTKLKFTENQHKLDLKSMVNSLEDKSNCLARLSWNSNNRNLILGDVSAFPCSGTKKTKRNSQMDILSNGRSGIIGIKIKSKAKSKNPCHSSKVRNSKFDGRKYSLKKMHEKVQRAERNFTCQVQGCDYVSTRKWCLQRHQMKHS